MALSPTLYFFSPGAKREGEEAHEEVGLELSSNKGSGTGHYSLNSQQYPCAGPSANFANLKAAQTSHSHLRHWKSMTAKWLAFPGCPGMCPTMPQYPQTQTASSKYGSTTCILGNLERAYLAHIFSNFQPPVHSRGYTRRYTATVRASGQKTRTLAEIVF